MMANKINWTTGPISASLGQTDLRVLILNNTSVTRKASVRVYDLSRTPKNKVFDETFTLKPWETVVLTLNVAGIELWEAQASAFSSSVRFYVAGRDNAGMNLVGNTVLNSQFKRFGS